MHYRDLEHPDITRVRRDGLPEAPDIHCPMCGAECETFYKGDGQIIGCENCITKVEAWEEAENL